jgi:hypothetical protein
MKYALASAVNLVTLLVGIAIGTLAAPHFDRSANAAAIAQVKPTTTTIPAPSNFTGTVTGPKITPVTPMLSGGTAAFYLLLSHHIQADEMVVNGYDLLKLQQGELNLLARTVPAADIAEVVKNSAASEFFTAQQNGNAQPPKPQGK